MIEELTPYPAYKECRLPWLENLPNTWSLLRGKNVFHSVDVRSRTGSEELLTVSANDGVVPRNQKSVTMFMAESYVGHKLCWPGDLVVNSLWAWMQGLGFSNHHGLISSAYSVYRPRPPYREYARYFHYLLRSPAYKWELFTRSKGVWLSRLQLSDAAFLDMPILVPPHEEQGAIARFLDHAERRIRRYIRAKQRLISLLEEQKRAITQRAVTRGLDPDVRLKASGVKWLGELPEHWTVRKLKHCLRAPLAYGVLKPDKFDGRDAVPIIRILDISDGQIDRTRLERISPLQDAEFARTQVDPGDVVISVVGTIGRSAVIPDDLGHVNLSRALCRIQLDATLDPKFLYFFSLSRVFLDQADRTPAGTAQRVLNLSDLRQFDIGVPPLSEQLAIVDRLEQDSRSTARAIERLRREIALLREYRADLITNVVTGKLNVGVAASRLPDEITESANPIDAAALSEADDAFTNDLEGIIEEIEA